MKRWTDPVILFGTFVVATMLFPRFLAAQDVPFTGIVVDEKVPIRAGAGRAYYIVGELKKGDVVQVEDVLFGWNKIVCPSGVYSYISKAFVDAKGDGRTGVVNSDGVEVKAGSINGPGGSYRGQLVLDKGDMVQILGQDGSFFKIVPPGNAYVFIRPGSVRRDETLQEEPAQQVALIQPQEPEPSVESDHEPLPPTEPAEPAQPKPAVKKRAQVAFSEEVTVRVDPPAEDHHVVDESGTEQHLQAGDEQPVDVARPLEAEEVNSELVVAHEQESVEQPVLEEEPEQRQDTETVTPPIEDVMDTGKGVTFVSVADSEALQELELKMMPMMEQPLDEQPLDEMIVAYEQIKSRDDLSSVDRQIIHMRIAAMKHNQELAKALKQLEDAQVTDEGKHVGLDWAVGMDQPADAVIFDAVGRLLASSVYNGESLPRMFRLVDSASKRTIAYIQPGGPVDTVKMLGKLVGVVGSQQYDPALKLQVFEVKQIKILAINE